MARRWARRLGGRGVRHTRAVDGWSDREHAILAALAETFVPGDGRNRARLAVGALTASADPSQVRQLRLVLRLLDSAVVNLLLTGRPRSFGSMTAEARERSLLGWAMSPLGMRRSAFAAYRKLLTFLAYADPGVDAPNPYLLRLDYRPDDPPVSAEPAAIRPFVVPVAGGAAGRDPDQPIVLEADAVIVGSGAGGGVMAARLASAGRSVIVVEAGPFVDEASMPRDELSAYDRLYLNHGLLTTWDGAVTMLAGTGVGGGTLINWMTCIPATASVRDEWRRDHGLTDLTGPAWDGDVAAIESELGVAESTAHSAEGRRPASRGPGAWMGRRPDPSERVRLRRLRQLSVRLPPRDKAVRHTRPPRPGCGGRRARDRRRPGHPGPGRWRSGGRGGSGHRNR